MATNSFHFDLFDTQLEIPMNLNSLQTFRSWITSDDAPEQGRFDYIDGSIEVDTSPEDLYMHGTLKTRMISVLEGLVHAKDLGSLFADSTRVSCPLTNLSVEPDMVYVAYTSVDTGQVRLVQKASTLDRYIEIEGAPDLIVEIVSDGSVRKDTKKLPSAYYATGISEYWLVDARGEQLSFCIKRRGSISYEDTVVDADGFQLSEILQHRFKLTRDRNSRGLWRYELLADPI